jgi:hypothetical protein
MLTALLATTVACSGSIGGTGDQGGGGPGGSAEQPGGTGSTGTGAPGSTTTGPGATPQSPQTAAACKASAPGASPIRRLTRFEYTNTVRDLLGVTDSPSQAFAPDAHTLGFDDIASAQTVSQLQVEQYEDAAARLANQAVQNLPTLLKCDPMAMGEDTCARKFIADFGRRAFRRPLAQAELDRYGTFYTAQKTKYGFSAAIELIVTAVLQSPHFLYRVEFGAGAPPTGVVKLTPFELATRLSYLIWSSMPDDALLNAADGGKLATPQDVATQAERMLADAKAKVAVAHFHQEWLETERIDDLQKDSKVYPTFTPALRDLMKKETAAFLDDLMFKGDGLLATLLQADYTFVNSQLAPFYGVTATGTTFVKVKLPAGQRVGFLGQASFLAMHAKPNQSSPIERGKFIREQLFCQDLPPPPNNIEIVPPMIKAGESTRQRFAVHTANPMCGGCHMLIDPVGFGLENFDGIGAWRDKDQGVPVDASGNLANTDVPGTYNGPLELAGKLAGSETVRGCVVTQWFRYAYGRGEDDGDACTLGTLKDQFKASGYNMRKLIVALTQTPAFLTRTNGGAQ